ncbi:MAG: hypothetical protein GX817_06560 [Elusimicrobia bacterium]|nr:hypothetical protein [Elusimicrobiota bacterium]
MHLVFSERKLKNLFSKWSLEAQLFTPDIQGRLVMYSEFADINLKKTPVWGSLKNYILPSRRAAFEDSAKEKSPLILVGVRNCDIRGALGILDRVFAGKEFSDPLYKKMRKNTLIVSVDCFMPADTCFCIQTGGIPFVSAGSDINITPLSNDQYLLESLSLEGKRLLSNSNARGVSELELRMRNDIRDTAFKKVQGNFNIDISRGFFKKTHTETSEKKEYWEELSANCIQCGACNFTCPTCYCTILNEVSSRNKFFKVLQWDSCLFRGYFSRAGKKNLLPKLSERFRYRYICKLSLMYTEFGISGCVGCGRCIQSCPAMIDMREIIRGLCEN